MEVSENSNGIQNEIQWNLNRNPMEIKMNSNGIRRQSNGILLQVKPDGRRI